MKGESSRQSKGIVVLSGSVSATIEQHRSREFVDRMKFFAEYFGLVHIISLNDRLGGRTARASESHRIFITPAKFWSIREQVRVSYILRRSRLVFADTQSDLIRNILAILLSRSRPILFFQGFVVDQFLLSVARSRGGNYIVPIVRVLASILERVSFRLARCVLCVSHSTVKYVREMLGSSNIDHVYFLPHSLSYVREAHKSPPLELSKLLDSHRDGIISYLGRLVESKRVHIALRAFAILLERGHDLALVLMGDGEEKRKLARLANQLGICSRTIFMGNIDQEKALSVLSISQLMIFPSESEGFSWSVLESLAVGCPVISYKYRSSTGDGLEKAVILLDSSDPNDFADNVEQVLLDGNLRRNLVERGLAFSKPYVSITKEARFGMIADFFGACQ